MGVPTIPAVVAYALKCTMVTMMQDWFVFTLFLQHKIALKIVIAVLGPSSLTEGFSANIGFLFCFCLSPLPVVGRLENNLKHISQVHTGLNVCICSHSLLSLKFSQLYLKNPAVASQAVQRSLLLHAIRVLWKHLETSSGRGMG